MSDQSQFMEPELLKVFVYGTLKPGEQYYDRYCAGKVIQQQQAMAYGELFDFPQLGYPAMTTGSSRVYGVVLTFADASSLEQLDELEDYQPNRPPEQNEYIRVPIETFSPDISDHSNSLDHPSDDQSLGWAWVYLMERRQAEQLGGVRVPQGNWTGR